MKRRGALSAMAAIFAAVALTTVPAAAWFRVCNTSTSNVWISYGNEATCSWPDSCDDGCGGSLYETNIRGWYSTAPGACSTVGGDEAYQYSHFIYAENGLGRWWGGGSGGTDDWIFQFIPQTAYNKCCDKKTLSNGTRVCEPQLGTSPSRHLSHVRRTTGADNYTLNLL